MAEQLVTQADPPAESRAADVTLTEYDEEKTEYEFSDTDEQFYETQIASDDGPTPLKAEFDRGGKITFRSTKFVGTVSFPDGPTVEVVPKAAGQNLAHLLQYAQGVEISTYERETTLERGDSFVDVLAALFIQEVDAVLRRGLRTDYRRKTTSEPHLRGRWEVQQQLQTGTGGPYPTEFECTYDDRTYETVANQSILYAATLLQRLVSEEKLRSELQWRVANLRQRVPLRRVTPAELQRVEVTRLNDYYTDLLRLVRPVLQQDVVGSLKSGEVGAFSLFVNMSNVFEGVIDRALSTYVEGEASLDARSQARAETLIHGTPEVNMYPDFVLERIGSETKTVVVGDAKWKTGTSKSGSGVVRNSDIYQMVAYSVAQDAPGLLIFPSQDGEAATEYRVEGHHRIRVYELPIETERRNYREFVTELEETFHDDLDELIKNYG